MILLEAPHYAIWSSEHNRKLTRALPKRRFGQFFRFSLVSMGKTIRTHLQNTIPENDSVCLDERLSLPSQYETTLFNSILTATNPVVSRAESLGRVADIGPRVVAISVPTRALRVPRVPVLHSSQLNQLLRCDVELLFRRHHFLGCRFFSGVLLRLLQLRNRLPVRGDRSHA